MTQRVCVCESARAHARSNFIDSSRGSLSKRQIIIEYSNHKCFRLDEALRIPIDFLSLAISVASNAAAWQNNGEMWHLTVECAEIEIDE